MNAFFDTLPMGTLMLNNRIIRCAIFEESVAYNGKMTSLLSGIYAELQKMKWGLS